MSQPHDRAEQEADEVADRAVAGLERPAGASESAADSVVHRDVGPAEEEDEEEERLEEPEQPEEVQASRDGGPATAPVGFRRAVAASGAGEPLPREPRRVLERALGASFAGVRLHHDDRSDRLARSIGARAFTWGSHVHLAARAPAPGTTAGLRLLAHELAHVRQQARGGHGSPVAQRSRALYFSTHGRQPYYEIGKQFHREQGFPPEVEVGSVEEMLEHLVTVPRPWESVRLVTHAVPAGIFLPLLRGGTTTLYAQDLTLQSQGALEAELSTEHPTVPAGRGRRRTVEVRELEHHVVPSHWAADAYREVAGARGGRQFLTARQFPTTMASGGPLEALVWWILDRELLSAERETRGRRGRTRMTPVLTGLAPEQRARAVASVERNIGIFRSLVAGLLALRPSSSPLDTPDRRRAAAQAAVAELEGRVVAAASVLIDRSVAGGGERFQLAQPSARYESVQGALERGTYSNNVLFAKAFMPNGMPFEIRGCRIGQNMSWLEDFRDFFGVGAEATRRRPDVSAPDLRHIFGQLPVRVRRGRPRPPRPVTEWLQGPRRRRILGGTPEFDAHIVHAR